MYKNQATKLGEIMISRLFFFTILLLLAYEGRPQEVDTLKYCIREGGIGLGGYDPVSYFTSSRPLLGSDEISYQYDGVIYWFASGESKTIFISEPEKFLPQFGGWCSMTLVLGKATAPTYTNFLVSDGKLYLFERTLSVDGKELWLRNHPKNKEIAAKNYSQLRKTGKAR